MKPVKNHSRKLKIANAIMYGFMALTSWPFLQLPAQGITHLTSPRISIKEAYEIIEKEKKNHEFKSDIELIVKKDSFESHAEKIDGAYRIIMQESTLKKPFIKHELYHILNGHLNEKKNSSIYEWLKRVYIQEPKTMLYQLGIIKR